MSTRNEIILDLAYESIFYKNSEGIYRILYTDMVEEGFQIQQEDTLAESFVYASDVKPEDSFFRAVEWKVSI